MGSRSKTKRPVDRLLVVMPTWLGDAVMATPTLRALRQLYPQAQISALARSAVRPAVDANPHVDRLITVRARRRGMPDGRRFGIINLARRLAARRFDLAVLLPNSFRTALLVTLAGIPRKVGYDRDGRGFLLTDRLIARRERGAYVPVPTRDYYLGLASYLGAPEADPAMQLFTRADDDERAARLLAEAGHQAGRQPLIVLTPGASYGDAKMWPAERFAALADRCVREWGAMVALGGAPSERAILERVRAAARAPILDLLQRGVDLTLFKSVIKRSSLVISNDTGPRHMAAAFGVPVVSLFGPTDPAWTRIDFPAERQVLVPVPCGPCQKKVCPLKGTPDHHQCMRRIDVARVFDQAAELLLASGKAP